VSRPARSAPPTNSRDRLKQDFARTATLREMYPRLAEVRVEFEFEDGTSPRPSPQSFVYFPSARGFFRYACPCHGCSGEFDLTSVVAELAGKMDRAQQSRHVSVSCTGQRASEAQARVPCPVCAQVRLRAIPQSPG
jgi:hypothetical protein